MPRLDTLYDISRAFLLLFLTYLVSHHFCGGTLYIGNMHFSLLATTVSLLCASATAFTPASTSGTDKLNDHGMTKLKTYLHKNRGQDTCNLDTAVKRQEWCVQSDQCLILGMC